MPLIKVQINVCNLKALVHSESLDPLEDDENSRLGLNVSINDK